MIEKIANICGFEILFKKKDSNENFSVSGIERKDI